VRPILDFRFGFWIEQLVLQALSEYLFVAWLTENGSIVSVSLLAPLRYFAQNFAKGDRSQHILIRRYKSFVVKHCGSLDQVI